MTVLSATLLLIGGLALLIKGADWLVDGAVSLANRLGVSPLVIGLTIVAMGTSAPEVAASVAAALKGAGNMAVGNVYGSNIANLALVGGLAAVIRPILVQGSAIRREMPAMIAVALLLWPVFHDLHLGRGESAVLLAVFATMILYTIHSARKHAHGKPVPELLITEQLPVDLPQKQLSAGRSVVFVLLGLFGLAVGAHLTVTSATFLGEKIGLSEAVIGITIVAIGTSLPELVTCVVAAVKGHDDISVGNIVGSNIFNTLLVIGTAGMVRPFDVEARFMGVDYWIMVAVSAVFLGVALPRKKIGRLPGLVLLTGYIAYMAYLFRFARG